MRFNNYYDRTTLGYGCINIFVPKIRAQTAPWCITPLKYFVTKGTNLYYYILFCYLIVLKLLSHLRMSPHGGFMSGTVFRWYCKI